MVRSTPPSQAGYLRYDATICPWIGGVREAAEWYDLHMPDEHEHKRPPAADRLDDREHPAQPEQTDEGFAEGQEQRPDSPEEEVVRDFAEGQEVPPRTEEEEHIGRFSEGQEEEGETPEKVVERRFSEGQDAGPDTT
jgi:hypothetical protein